MVWWRHFDEWSGLACHLTGKSHHIDHSEYCESTQHLHHATVHSTALCLCLSKALKQFLHDFISILIRHNIAHRIFEPEDSGTFCKWGESWQKRSF